MSYRADLKGCVGVPARYRKAGSTAALADLPVVYIEVQAGAGARYSRLDRAVVAAPGGPAGNGRGGVGLSTATGAIGVACRVPGETVSDGGVSGVADGICGQFGGIVCLRDGDSFDVAGVHVGRGDVETVTVRVVEVFGAGAAAAYSAKARVVL